MNPNERQIKLFHADQEDMGPSELIIEPLPYQYDNDEDKDKELTQALESVQQSPLIELHGIDKANTVPAPAIHGDKNINPSEKQIVPFHADQEEIDPSDLIIEPLPNQYDNDEDEDKELTHALESAQQSPHIELHGIDNASAVPAPAIHGDENINPSEKQIVPFHADQEEMDPSELIIELVPYW
jgi:hypothetical protein